MESQDKLTSIEAEIKKRQRAFEQENSELYSQFHLVSRKVAHDKRQAELERKRRAEMKTVARGDGGLPLTFADWEEFFKHHKNACEARSAQIPGLKNYGFYLEIDAGEYTINWEIGIFEGKENP